MTSEDSAASATGSPAPAGTRITHPAWNVLTGTLTSYVLLFVTIGLGIFLMPFTMGHLGKAEIRAVDAGRLDDRVFAAAGSGLR